jgi:hypothetical protein
MADHRSCFVALPFSPTASVSGEDAWRIVFEGLIRPAVESFQPQDGLPQFSCERQETRQGRWGEEIADRLLTADLAIVDLTDLNPNVCTELGIRLASGLPVIRISSTSTERLGNLAGHGTMMYQSGMTAGDFEARLHANMQDVLSSTRPANWLSPERQLLSRRVQDFHRRAAESLMEISEVTAMLTNRAEEGYFFYDFWRFCRYWEKSIAGKALTLAIEPSMFRSRVSEVARYGSWPVMARPRYHAAWPLFLGKDSERALGWLHQVRIEASLGSIPGEQRLPVEIRTEEFTEIMADGTQVVIPKIVGETTIPPGEKQLLLWIQYSGLFHPRVLPRMFFFPEGFVARKWSVEMNTTQTDLGCSVMPLVDRAQVVIRRRPSRTTEREAYIEMSPRAGSLLLPTDGALVSFFPADALDA